MAFEPIGTQLNVTEDFYDRLQQTISYNADGTVNTITATGVFGSQSVSWIRTFSYTSGKVTGISEWVKQ